MSDKARVVTYTVEHLGNDANGFGWWFSNSQTGESFGPFFTARTAEGRVIHDHHDKHTTINLTIYPEPEDE